jgi:hypothetical protein
MLWIRQAMMWTLVLWLYLTTATLLVVHEIDSAYWKEWELLRLPGGSGGFMLLHIPIVMLILFGAVALGREQTAGGAIALIVALGALAAAAIHTRFLRAGHPQFRSAVSLIVLGVGALAGLALAVSSVVLLVAGD